MAGKITFEKWIDDFGGIDKLASFLGVGLSTVYHWLNRRGYPKVTSMMEMVRASKGRLTYDTIIDRCRPAPRGRGARA